MRTFSYTSSHPTAEHTSTLEGHIPILTDAKTTLDTGHHVVGKQICSLKPPQATAVVQRLFQDLQNNPQENWNSPPKKQGEVLINKGKTHKQNYLLFFFSPEQ